MPDQRDETALASVRACMQRGDFAGVRAHCHAALSTIVDAKRQSAFQLWLGLAAQKEGALETALTHFEAARVADRHNARLLLQLGLVRFQLGQLPEAERCYRDAIRLEPKLELAHYNLGVLLQETRNFVGACRAFETALVHAPRFPEALNNLGNTLIELGELALAEECYRKALAIRPDLAVAHHALGLLLSRQQQRAAALPHLQEAANVNPTFIDGWLDLSDCQSQLGDSAGALASLDALLLREPSHAAAQFRRAVLTGAQPESAPIEVVERLYAGMAATFDEHLVERLGYNIPALLFEKLFPWLNAFNAQQQRKPNVLDLGCGTGLFGLQIRSEAATLIGVDLSPAMLDKARARGIYDELVVADLTTHLETAAPADLIVATDVLIYMGNLERLFTALRTVLSQGGVFAFSVECPATLLEGFTLQPSGRYAHSEHHIAQCAAAGGLVMDFQLATTIRMEANSAVAGYIYGVVAR